MHTVIIYLGSAVVVMLIESAEMRVYLRGVSIEDADQIARLANDRSIPYSVGSLGNFPYPYQRADALSFINIAIADESGGRGTHLSIIERGTNNLCGVIGLSGGVTGFSSELGYWVGGPFRGRGYATDAVRLAIHLGFSNMHLCKIYAYVFPENASSVKVLRNAGFGRECLLKAESIFTIYPDSFLDFMEISRPRGGNIDTAEVARRLDLPINVVESWNSRFVLKERSGFDGSAGDIPRDSLRFSILKNEYKPIVPISIREQV